MKEDIKKLKEEIEVLKKERKKEEKKEKQNIGFLKVCFYVFIVILFIKCCADFDENQETPQTYQEKAVEKKITEEIHPHDDKNSELYKSDSELLAIRHSVVKKTM